MTRRAALLGLLATVAACCPFTDHGIDHSFIYGSSLREPPEGTATMLQVVEERCPGLAGEVIWTEDPACTARFTGGAWGCASWGACAFLIEVWWAERVTDTALAHELGHVCLRTPDEERASAWAQEVNDETERRLEEPAP